jgi:hypothetical protein
MFARRLRFKFEISPGAPCRCEVASRMLAFPFGVMAGSDPQAARITVMFPKVWWVWVAAAFAIGVLVAVAVDRRAERVRASTDTSCHNPFRNRRATALPPRENIDLGVEEEEWPELKSLLKDFARSRDWSFRDGSVVKPGEVNAIAVSVCAERPWLNIVVLENHWKTTHAFDHPGRLTPVVLYSDGSTEQWQRVARELVMDLEAKWPGKVRFVDAEGQIRTARPKYLD